MWEGKGMRNGGGGGVWWEGRGRESGTRYGGRRRNEERGMGW